MLTELNTQFVEHTIFIMKNILDNNKNEQPAEHLSVTSIEGMMLAIVRYDYNYFNRIELVKYSLLCFNYVFLFFFFLDM